MSDVADNICKAREVDEVRAEDKQLESRVFSINVRARFTYLNRDLLDEGEDEEDGDFFLKNIDCYECMMTNMTHSISYDRMSRDPNSAVYDMLDSMYIPVEDFMVEEITKCAKLMMKNKRYKKRKALRMSVFVDVFVEPLPFTIDEAGDEAIPKYKEMDQGLERVMIEEKADDCCAICLDKLHVGLEARKTPCSHLFHSYCIGKWLWKSLFCPVCRFRMPIPVPILF